MTNDDRKALLHAAIAAVRNCADKMEDRAASLLETLSTLPMDEGLRARALQQGARLRDASGRVTFELALLQAELSEARADAATAVERLTGMDATLMGALAAMTDVADELERDAERDSRHERAFVLVIEAAGLLLQSLDKARTATAALRAGA
jgi:hypothetical protein